MLYSPMIKKACQIMYDAHREDMDKGGYPYVFHPFYLATQMTEEDAVCTALLHDVVEDHGDRYPLSALEEAGFSSRVIRALTLLTHDPAVPYMDYVRCIGEDTIARQVKIADLKHNMDTARLNGARSRKWETYQQALTYLEGLTEEDR